MPADIETRVMKLLSAIEVPPSAATRIASWGNDAVTVLCEAALGSIPSLTLKVRSNAAALVGVLDHPQARETLELLIADRSPAVAIRAIRAVGRSKTGHLVGRLGQLISNRTTPPLVVAEAVSALLAIDSKDARAEVEAFEATAAETNPNRASPIVERILRKRKKPR
jgi:HEAT repeat protein